MNSGGFFPAQPVLRYKLSFFIVNSTFELKKNGFFKDRFFSEIDLKLLKKIKKIYIMEKTNVKDDKYENKRK